MKQKVNTLENPTQAIKYFFQCLDGLFLFSFFKFAVSSLSVLLLFLLLLLLAGIVVLTYPCRKIAETWWSASLRGSGVWEVNVG